MGNTAIKKRVHLDNDIEQYCQEVEEVLTQIHTRIDKTESKKKKKNKKNKDLIFSGKFVPYSFDPEE